MSVYDLEAVLEEKAGDSLSKLPSFFRKLLISILKKVVHIKEINSFFNDNPDASTDEFLALSLKMAQYSYNLSDEDKAKIPAKGRLIITSNHPLGGLDGVALLSAVREVRTDVHVLSNDVLAKMPNTEGIFLPVDVFNRKNARKSIMTIKSALEREECLIFFPAGMVSRFRKGKIRDLDWYLGAMKFASKFSTPILPIYLKARNTFLFYFLALFHNAVGALLLPHELFTKKGKTLKIKIGTMIQHSIIADKNMDFQAATDKLYKYTYDMRKATGNHKYEI